MCKINYVNEDKTRIQTSPNDKSMNIMHYNHYTSRLTNAWWRKPCWVWVRAKPWFVFCRLWHGSIAYPQRMGCLAAGTHLWPMPPFILPVIRDTIQNRYKSQTAKDVEKPWGGNDLNLNKLFLFSCFRQTNTNVLRACNFRRILLFPLYNWLGLALFFCGWGYSTCYFPGSDHVDRCLFGVWLEKANLYLLYACYYSNQFLMVVQLYPHRPTFWSGLLYILSVVNPMP